MLSRRTWAIAAALCLGSSFEAMAAPRPAARSQPVLTRSEFASSLAALVKDLEASSHRSWKVGTGAYTLADVPGYDSRRGAILALVNDYRLWDGAGTITHESFKPGQAVTRGEVERVLRNLWALKAKVQPGVASPPSLTLAAGPRARAADKVTRAQYAAFSRPTFGMMRELVRLGYERTEAELRAAKEASASVAREAAAVQAARERDRVAEEVARAQEALVQKDADLSAQARVAQDAQLRQRAESARLAEAERKAKVQGDRAAKLEAEARQAKEELERTRAADELRARAEELERIVKEAQAAASAEAEKAKLERQERVEDLLAGRFQGSRPLGLELSGLPWLSTSVPASAFNGPTAGARLALYRDDLLGEYDAFGMLDARAGAYPGGPATVKAGLGPQGPIFDLGRLASLQFQPYFGGRADFGWAGTQLVPSGGPAAGVVSHLRLARLGIFGIAEAALPWTGSGVAFQPTSTFALGAELDLGRQVALVAGWNAEYGAGWLPYTGSLTTGVQLGL